MRALTFVLASLLALATPALAQMPGSTPAASGVPYFVQLVSSEGLPKEPAARSAFLDAFRMAFAEDEFALSAPAARGSGVVEGEKVANRFRLLEGSASSDAWSMQLVLGTPPLVLPAKPARKKNEAVVRRHANTLGRATRGLTVVFMLLSPQAVKADARPIPVKLGLVFPDPSAIDGVGDRVSSGGYEFPWSDAGRAAGLLALELLHQRAGEIKEQQQAFLGVGVVRAEAGR